MNKRFAFQSRSFKAIKLCTLLSMGAFIAYFGTYAAAAHDQIPTDLPSPKHINEPVQPTAFPLYPSNMMQGGDSSAPERWDSFGPDLIVRNVARPTITPFLPDPAKATGAGVIVAPGGGFMILSIKNEGWDVARWLADHGVAAFVLKYRTEPTPENEDAFEKFAVEKLFRPLAPGEKREHPVYEPSVSDAISALNLIKSHANNWNIDPSRLGLLGFSAGAATSLEVTLRSDHDTMPAFVGLLYSPPRQIKLPAAIPPLFAAVASDDVVVGPDMSVVDAWHAAGQSAEYHLYARGGHGFGMHKSGATTDLWPEEFLAWLKSNGFLDRHK